MSWSCDCRWSSSRRAAFYPDPDPVLLLLAVLGRAVQEPFRPMGRKGLDSEVMTMLGIRPIAPLITWPSAKSVCETETCSYCLIFVLTQPNAYMNKSDGLTFGMLPRSLAPAMDTSVSKDVWKKNRQLDVSLWLLHHPAVMEVFNTSCHTKLHMYQLQRGGTDHQTHI